MSQVAEARSVRMKPRSDQLAHWPVAWLVLVSVTVISLSAVCGVGQPNSIAAECYQMMRTFN